ncbi:MAG: hypothetical protein AAF441_17730 [Pseudomonadota bacterium]
MSIEAHIILLKDVFYILLFSIKRNTCISYSSYRNELMLQIVNPEAALAHAEPWIADESNRRMHAGVYRWLLVLNIAILLIAWGTFQEAWEALFMIVVCAAYVAMYFGTPYAMLRAAKIDLRDSVTFREFLNAPFETCTGRIKGWEAAIQVCLIPASIVFAFASFWVILSLVR